MAFTAARRGCGRSRHRFAPVLAILLALAAPAEAPCQAGQSARPPAATISERAESSATSPAASRLVLKVLSENGNPIASAEVALRRSGGGPVLRGETDYLGTFTFAGLSKGDYQLSVEKQGFYVAELADVHVGTTRSVMVTLNHLRKIAESVQVIYSPPIIDPTATASSSSLNNRQIIDLPYPVARDLRYALPLIPGVLQDATGQIHVDGSRTSQVMDELDGFDVTDPITRDFNVRIAPEALRSIDLEDARYPVRYGRSSGGILALNAAMGDNHDRFAGVNFLPTLDSHEGLHISSWTPRLTFSGPLVKNRAWFMDSFDGEYDLFMVNGLPAATGTSKLFRVSNLAKTQINVARSNILTASFLMNRLTSPHYGLSLTTPLESTINTGDTTNFVSVRDQVFLSKQDYLELGLAWSTIREHQLPWGDQTYVMYPGFVSGSFFESSRDRAGRTEEFANLYVPAKHWFGEHLLEFGTGDEEISYTASYDRNPLVIENSDREIIRKATFTGNEAFFTRDSAIGGYAQDRWSVLPRLLVESGARFDWDSLVRDPVLSPRWAATFLPREQSETKLVAGIGMYTDATSLDLITRPLGGERIDQFYDPATQLAAGPAVETSFQLQPHLKQPRVWSWSGGVEQKLPGSIYFRGEYVQKRETDGWAYFNSEAPGTVGLSGNYELRSAEREHYDAIETTFRRGFARGNLVMLSYVHSTAHSNAVLDFDLENPIFAEQSGGPLPWDAPNRLLSWGLVPLIKGFNLAYTLDWRTGFPFSVVNQNELLVGAPDRLRMPAYFSVDAALERRISLLGFKWDVRAGFDDLTGRHNPYAVNNNIDSPQFGAYSSTQRRALQAQIRLLGRK